MVYDQTGRQIFSAIDKTNPKLPEPPSAISRVKHGNYGRIWRHPLPGDHSAAHPVRNRRQPGGVVEHRGRVEAAAHHLLAVDVSGSRVVGHVCGRLRVRVAASSSDARPVAANRLHDNVPDHVGGGHLRDRRPLLRWRARQIEGLGRHPGSALGRHCRIQPAFQRSRWNVAHIRRIQAPERGNQRSGADRERHHSNRQRLRQDWQELGFRSAKF